MDKSTRQVEVSTPVRKKIKLTNLPFDDGKVPSVEEVYEKNLPLLANVDFVHISHYLMSLRFDFDKKIVDGTLIIFPVKKLTPDSTPVVEIVLDACSLEVTSVSCVAVNLQDLPTNPTNLYLSVTQISPTETNLDFEVNKWSLTIKIPTTLAFPSAVKIEYKTLPSSPSIQWRPVKGFNVNDAVPLCCFTPAAPVNNRGLFPCQEAPSALGTWDCFVILENSYSAFLSSDQPAMVIETNDQFTVSYFNCSEVLPMSNFAFIVSQFSPSNIVQVQPTAQSSKCDQCSNNSSRPVATDCSCKQLKEQGQMESPLIPFRFVFQNDPKIDVEKLSTFVIRLLQVSYSVLGKIPFQRLDIILMPDCFPTLGLCSPSMIFLSDTVLQGHHPLIYSRLTHELGHFWFGISLGALNWTEEFLSEGFATFTEDIFHRMILEQMLNDKESTTEMQQLLKEEIQEIKLKPCIRLVTLQHELENTNSEQELQLLKPNDCENSSLNKVVVNGLEPLKQFMQVHYLKGYLFLVHLSNLVGGETKFLKFLKSYVSQFQGKLVTSDDFLNFFKDEFCDNQNSTSLCSADIDSLSKEWLQSSTLPEPYKSANVGSPLTIMSTQTQCLFHDCIDELMKINYLTLWFNCQQELNNSLTNIDNIDLNATEKLLLLEQILESNQNLEESKIDCLEKLVKFENPEVDHRLCEIIVKFQCLSKSKTVQNFLLYQPAMGIYLYGELIISERRKFQRIARKLYEKRKLVMDPPCVHVLKQMIF